MSMGASASKEGSRPGSLVRAGRPRGRRADRPRVGSLPPPNRYVREMTDSGNRKLASSSFQHDNRSQFSIGWMIRGIGANQAESALCGKRATLPGNEDRALKEVRN
jgi:hypothetical protein